MKRFACALSLAMLASSPVAPRASSIAYQSVRFGQAVTLSTRVVKGTVKARSAVKVDGVAFHYVEIAVDAALKSKPDLNRQSTLDQMLVALFKSNAGAFDGNNMNRLRSGAIITVPSAEDAAATLTAFTAASVLRLFPHLPTQPQLLIVCGGGARNPILVRELVMRLPCKVTTANAVGWSADSMEAQAFAYLAARVLEGLPITFPTTTGAPRTVVLAHVPSSRRGTSSSESE